MIPAATEFITALKRGYTIEGSDVVIAEWNYNNLFSATVTNPNTANWIMNTTYFPPQSIVTGIRPTRSGMFYALTNESYASSQSELTNDRYYVVNDNANYKYWICPTPSSTAETVAVLATDDFPTPPAVIQYAVDNATLIVDYGRFLNMNKLHALFNLGPVPLDWSFYVFEQTANDWVEIANPTVDPVTGKAEMWWNGTAWVSTQQLSESVFQKISKVKIQVRSVDQPNRRLQVVEVAGKREIDITGRVESYSVNMTLDNEDYVNPVGRLTSNDGQLALNNNDLKMEPDDPNSDFFGMLEGWCQYRTYVKYDLSPYGGDANYLMRTGTMYCNDHDQTNEYQYSVALFDVFKIIQSITVPATLFENVSIAKIFQNLLDLSGIDTYNFESEDFDTTNLVKYFWTDGTEKLFDVLDRLCHSYQAASFVDEFGDIRLLVRNDITPKAGETTTWTFLGEQQGLDVPDVISLQKKYNLQANQVNIKYNRREAKTDDTDITSQPLTTSIWQASDTVVLRSSPLTRSLIEGGISDLPNRSFEEGTIWWTASGVTFTASAEKVYQSFYQGALAAKLVPNGTSASGYITSSTVKVPSSGLLEADGRVWVTNAVSNNFSMTVKWYDSNMNLISTADAWRDLTAGTWNYVDGIYSAPAAAVYATLVPTLRGTPASSQIWYLDDLNMFPKGYRENTNLWVDSTAAETWPFKGTVNVEGEVIDYDGKGYAWWDYSSGTGVYKETVVKDNDSRKAIDKQSYLSWHNTTDSVIGGVSSDPTKQNKYTGRLWTTKRDSDETGQSSSHDVAQSYGWYTMDFWTDKSYSNTHPGHYFSPGPISYDIASLQDWVKKPGWCNVQRCATVSGSILTVDNHTNTNIPHPEWHATVVTKSLGNTEYREMGTRLRISSNGDGRALVAFYMTNTTGYDTTTSPMEEPYYCNRCYILTVNTTDFIERDGRSYNEVLLEVKNFDSLTRLETLPHMKLDANTDVGNGRMQIVPDKWYDVDLVFRDGVGDSDSGVGGRSTIEVYIDGAYVDTWITADNIRPTGLVALGAKAVSKVDFEYFYATTTTNKGRNRYLNEDAFDSFHVNLPAGTNMKKRILFPFDGVRDNDFGARGVMSLSTFGSAASISTMEFASSSRKYVSNIVGAKPIQLKPDQRMTLEISDYNYETGYVTLTYTAAHDISVCFEYTTYRSYPYGIDTEAVPPIDDYYDYLKGGYYSSKKDELFYTPQRYANAQYTPADVNTSFRGHFFDDFGAVAHEIRDFDVNYDISPAKGVGIYCSNDHAKLIGHDYSPIKGKFRLVNISHRDEIINGTEQIDDTNSINYSLMAYGYVLEDKGALVETVTNDLSVIRHGLITQDLDASWIFDQDSAKALGTWITSNWGNPMDTIQLSVFSNTHIQIGDKVSINYPNASIDPTWIYVVTGKSIIFDDTGLGVSITLRRVQ